MAKEITVTPEMIAAVEAHREQEAAKQRQDRLGVIRSAVAAGGFQALLEAVQATRELLNDDPSLARDLNPHLMAIDHGMVNLRDALERLA